MVAIPDAGIGGIDRYPIMQAQLVDQGHHFDIIGKPVMVEAIQLVALYVEGAGQAAEFGVGFEHGYGDTCARQFPGGGQASEAAADNGDASGSGECGHEVFPVGRALATGG